MEVIMIYLDHAATTPIPREVADAMYQVLTEQFGICGIGWKTQIVRTWIDEGANGESITNVEILLFIKVDGEWSEGIPGIGGSKLTSKEKDGIYTDDECYKKAYTDAISVACKALGVGADIYWNENTKYSGKEEEPLTYETALALEFTFGQNKGKTLKEVYKSDRGYIDWLRNNEKTDKRIKDAIALIDAEIAKNKAQKTEEKAS